MTNPVPSSPWPTALPPSLIRLLTTLLPPAHLLAYSTLVGAQLHQTFLVTGLNYRHLPRPAFKTLQKAAFPAYFRFQTVLVVLTAVTVPTGGLLGLFWEAGGDAGTRAKWDLAALGAALGTAVLNRLIYGPRTTVAMDVRTRLETRAREEDKRQIQRDELNTDSKNDAEGTIVALAEPDPELKAAARNFSRNHAMSIHLNLVTIVATLIYGWGLAGRIAFS